MPAARPAASAASTMVLAALSGRSVFSAMTGLLLGWSSRR
jgi:hypothetical protein